MDLTDFWDLIEAARADASPSTDDPGEALASAMVDRLAATSEQTVLEFEELFGQLHAALYRWDVWAAAYLIGGGCSDDAFLDFRAGLIAQGRDWYARAAALPDALAEHPDVIASAAECSDEALFNESVNYTASHAYRRISGSEDTAAFHAAYDAFRATRTDGAPTEMGEDFDFDDDAEMHARLPRLAHLYLGPVGH
ncbi:DUF4240 domain-containing protein [Streptomyces sp. CBMA156]|uniref:DUF4240 domain-containing protein n=1 Tax=Streptomyces sp. CBMA156 TaxID=1930280 RepID=UPI001661C7E6|nr:DUF4240 domain-containing protein [Streptomyces sp. CBMA156]MBD0673521.1 hypothetical protein [Streptomyces sp. CBMA156]